MWSPQNFFILLGVFFASCIALQSENDGTTNKSEIFEYILLSKKHPCTRKCVSNSIPMTCRYKFVLEAYHTMSKACYNCPFVKEDCFRTDCIPGDGTKRGIVVVNRKMPGPSIEVCLGDEVIIDVENKLASDSTTIHWHGHHQRDNPYMDGVPYVTQCPILPEASFRYQFKVQNAGSHFWHSHSGFQRADGAFGPFIVRKPVELDPHSKLYDYDLSQHIITILDWSEVMGLEKFVAHHHNDGDNKPSTILINGLGRFYNFNTDNETITIPPARFTVTEGYRYRFRVINAGFLNCPIEISVDNHTLLAISSDGNDFEAIETESIVTYAGERFDFILKADQPKDVYWMRFSGLMDCDERFKRAHQVAVLEYKNSEREYPDAETSYETSRKPGKQINALNKGTESNNSVYVSLPQFKSFDEKDMSLKEKPDFKYYVSYDFYRMEHNRFHKFPYYGFHNVSDKKKQLLLPQLNHISMKLPSTPLLSQRYEIDENLICNETTVTGCEKDLCECSHIVQVPLNAVVELVLIDKGFAFDANHPFHLHGHSFRVVAMEKLGSNTTVQKVLHHDLSGKIKRNLDNPPVKDTVTVPDGGYTVLRFHASNPGYWLFHCHIEFHVEVGMALVFKVGKNEEMPPIPSNFPKCGDYMPTNTSHADCEKGLFADIVQNLLPHVYDKYCRSSGSSINGFSVYSTTIIFLISYFINR